MTLRWDINFENDIVGIDKDNVKEKIIPYINELISNLIRNECRNIRVATKIRRLTGKEAEVYITLRDIDDL